MKVLALLDKYDLVARVFPTYLAIFPLAAVIVALLPEPNSLLIGAGSAIVLLPLAYLAAQLGADFGKRREKGLWEKWGGPPTTRFLRYSNNEFNSVVRDRVHATLRLLGFPVPTPQEEERDPTSADQRYEACVQELIRRTRHPKRFPHVFRELTAYGFRRNLLGVKPIGLPLTVLAFALSSWQIWATWGLGKPSTAGTLVAWAVSVILSFVWVLWVNERAVRLAADRYARFLLEAAVNLEV